MAGSDGPLFKFWPRLIPPAGAAPRPPGSNAEGTPRGIYRRDGTPTPMDHNISGMMDRVGFRGATLRGFADLKQRAGTKKYPRPGARAAARASLLMAFPARKP